MKSVAYRFKTDREMLKNNTVFGRELIFKEDVMNPSLIKKG